MSEEPTVQIVIAEDSPTQSMLLVHLLEKAGYGTKAFADGQAALTEALSSFPDLIISDVNMPEMSGPDLVAAVRADESLAGTKVILVTSPADSSDMELLKATGADGYLVKPIKPDTLIKCVEETLAGPTSKKSSGYLR